MSDKTGGPAFPFSKEVETLTVIDIEQIEDGKGSTRTFMRNICDPGMTLLDYFAGQAMQGRMACGAWQASAQYIANEANVVYRIAEAMLAEKARREKDDG